MQADEIRSAFLSFQEQNGHVRLARSPLVPRDDPSTLFTGSGMQALLPYLLGRTHPDGTRLTDSQTCLRVQDMGEVGDNRHTTFFEMLGNWSLGDYCKREQLSSVWTFMTERISLDPSRIYVSCFSGDEEHDIPKDTECADIWTGLFDAAGLDSARVDLGTEEQGYALGTGGARIAFYSKKNWWCRGGSPAAMPLGDPGGPDSEIFYVFPEIAHDTRFGPHCHQNCDCGRFMEIGNSVFTEYRKTATGFEPLPLRNVDFGGGLERIAAASIDSPDVYRISVLWPIVAKLEQMSGADYATHTRQLRVIADHLRGATFLAVDGVRPGNKEQGYVMRRLLRRAIRFAFDVGLQQNFFAEIVPVIADLYHDSYPEVAAQRDSVIAALIHEEEVFRRTLRKGLKQVSKLDGQTVTGADLFVLYDTYGFPPELGADEVVDRGNALTSTWREEFDSAMAAQRARSQAMRR